MATAAPPDSGVVPRGRTDAVVQNHPPGSGSGGVGGVSSVVGPNSAGQIKSAVPKSVHHPQLGVSASVGHDHWANHVLSAVQDHREGAAAAAAEAATEPAASTVAATGSSGPSVKEIILEKKRKFHSGRMLELKNLPDGCTEQVGKKAHRLSGIICLKNGKEI